MAIEKVRRLTEQLNAEFPEREEVIESLALALIARRHVLLIGPAGTGKSALARRFAESVTGLRRFEWLLNRFSTPEELFGPISLRDLEAGKYRRNTEGKMPETHIAFLDEIFKANSAVLNSLLTLINERLFHNGSSPIRSPLMTVIAASNEYPEDREETDALYDRFLLRHEVGSLSEEANFLRMLQNTYSAQKQLLSMDELAGLQRQAAKVFIPADLLQALANIRRALKDEGIHPSDRRFRQSLRLLQAKAVLSGRNEVESSDLTVLKHVLWEEPDQKETTALMIDRHAENKAVQTLESITYEAMEIYETAIRDRSVEAGMEAMKKLKVLLGSLERLTGLYPHKKEEIQQAAGQLRSMEQDIISCALSPVYIEAHRTSG